MQMEFFPYKRMCNEVWTNILELRVVSLSRLQVYQFDLKGSTGKPIVAILLRY